MAILQPGNILHDRRYLCVGPENRQQIARYLSQLWYTANDDPERIQRIRAFTNIRMFSKTVHDWIRYIEAVTLQKKIHTAIDAHPSKPKSTAQFVDTAARR